MLRTAGRRIDTGQKLFQARWPASLASAATSLDAALRTARAGERPG
jgi:hypothetical protein